MPGNTVRKPDASDSVDVTFSTTPVVPAGTAPRPTRFTSRDVLLLTFTLPGSSEFVPGRVSTMRAGGVPAWPDDVGAVRLLS